MFSPAVFPVSSLKYVSRLISTGGKEADGNREAGSHTDVRHISQKSIRESCKGKLKRHLSKIICDRLSGWF